MVSGGSIPQYRPMISTELQAERVLKKMKKDFFANESFYIVGSQGTFIIRNYFLAYDRPHTQTEREFNGLPKAERVRIKKNIMNGKENTFPHRFRQKCYQENKRGN